MPYVLSLRHKVSMCQMSTIGMGWSEIHWLARDGGGLMAAMFKTWT
jgi:hypothetical protein